MIVMLMLTATMRANARRAGHPEPIISEATVRPLPGGGYALAQGTNVPLREEWGGTERDAEAVAAKNLAPTPDPGVAGTDMKPAKDAADRIKAQLRKMRSA
jgi:hypothetical protein